MKKTVILSLLFVLVVSQFTFAHAEENSVFKDIEGHWGKETITWAVVKGMVTGYTDGTFKPNNLVTESEFLALLVRAYRPEILVADKGIHWAENYYTIARELNYVLKGMNDINARNAVINRGYVAELIAGTQGFNYAGDDAIRYLLGEGLAKGTDPYKVTIKSYKKDGLLSRAEAVQFIRNVVESGTETLMAKPIIPSNTSTLTNIPSGKTQIGNAVVSDLLEIYNNQLTPLEKAREISIEFIKSIRVEGKKVYFTGPKLPSGFTFDVGVLDYEQPNVNPLKTIFGVRNPQAGKEFEVDFYGNGGYLMFSMTAKGVNHGNNIDGATIFLPSLELVSGFGEW